MPTNNEPLVLTLDRCEPLVLTVNPPYVGSAVSPTVDITETSDDVTVTITDINGEHSYTIEKTDQAIADAESAASAANNAASAASTAATRANTSADNADAATTAANSAAAAATAATVDTEAATAAANSAASSATSAAANANAAADRVDTAIDDAESAASAANSAATSATNAASAANTAASNANAKATLADTAATNANTKAGLADSAATAANSAAQSAGSAASTASTAASNADAKATAANTAASAANTAASSANDAADRVDAALETLDDDLKISDSASGASVLTNGCALLDVEGDGWAEQDGTPTPSAPVDVQVAKGRNLLDTTTAISSSAYGITISRTDDVFSISGTQTNTSTAVLRIFGSANDSIIAGAGEYVFSIKGNATLSSNVKAQITYDYGTDSQNAKYIDTINGSVKFTANHAVNNVRIWLNANGGQTVSGNFVLQLEKGSTATPYVPYGHVGLEIKQGSTLVDCIPVPIPSDGLAALPDGTHDTLSIDSAGHVVIENRVGYIASYNGESVGSVYISTTGELSTGASVYYKLATPTTIDMGYIDLPLMPDGCTVSIPELHEIGVEWVVTRAEAIPDMVADVRKWALHEIALAGDAELSTIAAAENATASTNYAVGSYLVHAGTLYRVTTAIATGETITPGSNVTATTVMAELIRLTA